jgi:GrpB-like predicted nucleotidyltransferase (UPF0157 family)
VPDEPERVLIGGRERRTIEIADHDSAWAQRYEALRAPLAAALRDVATRIDHVGSTAVPGLGAKPIVDVQVSVPDPDDEDAFGPALEALGYALRVREPGHRMYRAPALDVHVHVWESGSEDERRHLLFRDWLRCAPADRQLYEQVKRDLAACEWADMNEYADAKTAVIGQIAARAEAWAAASKWTAG